MTAIFANPIVKRIIQVAVLYAYTHIVLDLIYATVKFAKKLRPASTPHLEA